MLSRYPVRLFATPWTAACQAPLSMGFPRQAHPCQQIIKIRDMDKAQCTDKGSILPEGFSFDFIVKTSAIVTKTGSCLIDRVSCRQPEGHLSKNPGAWPETWRSSNSGAFIWKTREDPERMNWSSRQCSNQKEFYMFSQSIKMISPGTKEIDQKKKSLSRDCGTRGRGWEKQRLGKLKNHACASSHAKNNI